MDVNRGEGNANLHVDDTGADVNFEKVNDDVESVEWMMIPLSCDMYLGILYVLAFFVTVTSY